MQAALFQTLTRHVTDDTPPRVWSLLVTVFGELAQEPDARISGSLLRALSEHIGIKPEAIRVALHRLRKDGWIESERTGRTSAYFLTPRGRAQSNAASPLIYAKDPAADNAWLLVFNPGHPVKDSGIIGKWISSNLLLTATPPDIPEAVSTEIHATDALPDWLTSKVCDPATVKLSQDFLAALDALQISLGTTSDLTPIQTAALRVLLVHSWRRIILKAPILPDHVFPPKWCGIDCRARMSLLLEQLAKQNPSDLEQQISMDAAR